VSKAVAPAIGLASLLFAAVGAHAQLIQRNPAAARAALDDVLALPMFNEQDWISMLPVWLVPVALLIKALVEFIWNVMRWPIDRLLDLLARLVDEAVRRPVVLLLAVLAIAGLALLYQRGLRSAIVRQVEIPGSDQPLPPTANEALALAARQAAAGRYREACHFVLLSSLLAIEERGHARFDPSATNREHLAKLAGWPPLARALERVVGRFDRVWYGQGEVSESDYRDLLNLATSVAEAAA